MIRFLVLVKEILSDVHRGTFNGTETLQVVSKTTGRSFFVSVVMIKEKSKYFYEELIQTESKFNGSDDWLDRFNRRFGAVAD